MEIGASTLAARETALNKANTDRDILLKTLEENAETKAAQDQNDSKPVDQVNSDKQGRIDLYA